MNFEPCLWGRSPKGGVSNLEPISLGTTACINLASCLLDYRLRKMKTMNDRKQETNILIPPVILPEGYNGKILLMSVNSARINNTVILRSGDLWHREILRNTENEIQNHGITDAQIHQLGGAMVRFEPDGTIIIYGRSQEFGPCDKAYAADLIRGLFPKRRVEIRN